MDASLSSALLNAVSPTTPTFSMPGDDDPKKKGLKMPIQAVSRSTVSPEDLEKFANYLPEGQRSPFDYANEMSKRGYWGAPDMMKGAQDSAAGFAKDNRANPEGAAADYKDDRKYSQLWHNELIQNVLTTAKKWGIKDKQGMLANKDALLANTRLGTDDFNKVMNVPAGAGESKADNFWRVTGDLYNDQNAKQNLPAADIASR